MLVGPPREAPRKVLDNADRVDGRLAEESTDTYATCLYRRGEAPNP